MKDILKACLQNCGWSVTRNKLYCKIKPKKRQKRGIQDNLGLRELQYNQLQLRGSIALTFDVIRFESTKGF